MKFLIDECLSVKLARLAHEHGYGESSHIAWLDLSGTKDWDLIPIIVGGDWTFVKRNSITIDREPILAILANLANMGPGYEHHRTIDGIPDPSRALHGPVR